jgi:hypothetical protein
MSGRQRVRTTLQKFSETKPLQTMMPAGLADASRAVRRYPKHRHDLAEFHYALCGAINDGSLVPASKGGAR